MSCGDNLSSHIGIKLKYSNLVRHRVSYADVAKIGGIQTSRNFCKFNFKNSQIPALTVSAGAPTTRTTTITKMSHNSDRSRSDDSDHSERSASESVVSKQSVDDEQTDSFGDVKQNLIASDAANMDQDIPSASDVVKQASNSNNSSNDMIINSRNGNSTNKSNYINNNNNITGRDSMDIRYFDYLPIKSVPTVPSQIRKRYPKRQNKIGGTSSNTKSIISSGVRDSPSEKSPSKTARKPKLGKIGKHTKGVKIDVHMDGSIVSRIKASEKHVRVSHNTTNNN